MRRRERVLVTGSAGHLGEGLMRVLAAQGRDAVGMDRLESPYTHVVGSIADRSRVREALDGVGAVLHTATLHKPHVATHSREDFLETNVRGTAVLLEEAVAAGVEAFVFTSTTSTFGRALRPGPGEPAVWVIEELRPVPRNIYGVTKVAAEDLCQLVHQDHGLPCLVLRTSRFFPEADDVAERREAFEDQNLKVNELLNRRADLQDLVDGHLLALERAPEIGFDRFVLSATTPFLPEDVVALRGSASEVVARRVPEQPEVYASRGWRLPEDIGRVYDNARARAVLGWEPRFDFAAALRAMAAGEDPRSPLARAVGSKGYHPAGGTYP